MTEHGVTAVPGGNAVTLRVGGVRSRRSIRFRHMAVDGEPGEAALVDALRRGD